METIIIKVLEEKHGITIYNTPDTVLENYELGEADDINNKMFGTIQIEP